MEGDYERTDKGAAAHVEHTMNAGDVSAAQAATTKEHNMSVMDAFRRYPKAVMFSLIFSTAVIMEGYDLVIIGSFYAQPQFSKHFGHQDADGSYQVTAEWQAGLSNASQVGSILGLMLNGSFSERFGYRKTMLGALFVMSCFIFLTFFANSITMLLIGELLCGLPWGIFQTLTIAFASEVCPVPLRPFLTTYVNLAWVLGQFIASGVLRGFLNVQGEYAYRGPFAIQWIWPIPIAIGVLLSPESPWWLVRKGRVDDARASLRRFCGAAESDEEIDQTIAMIQYTNEVEKQYNAGTSYADCFKGANRRRTEITCIIWMTQNWCGNGLMSQSTYFYEQAGLKTAKAFDMSMVQYSLGAIGTIGSWFIMRQFGRRTLYLSGMAVMTALMCVIGGLGFAHPLQHASVSWTIGSLLIAFIFVYDFTVGPVCYTIVSEMSSTRLRAKTIVLSRNLYNIIGIVGNVITPNMLNPTAWNWGAKAGLFWVGMNVLNMTYAYFRLPETRGRTYGELDVLFEHGVSARAFAGTPVEQFPGHRDEMDEKAPPVPTHVH